MPTTITSHVMSSSMLKDLSNYCCQRDGLGKKEYSGKGPNNISHKIVEVGDSRFSCSGASAESSSSVVLAGLHACGDLSVTMLRYVCFNHGSGLLFSWCIYFCVCGLNFVLLLCFS